MDIECAAGELAVEVEQEEATTETFCGTYTTYKAEVWTITATVYPSYGADGLWTLLRPFVGMAVPFSVVPDRDATVNVENPIMSGTAIVKAFPFYMGSPGEPTSFDVEIAVQGAPDFRDRGHAAHGGDGDRRGVTIDVVLDTTDLVRGLRQLDAGLDRATDRVGLESRDCDRHSRAGSGPDRSSPGDVEATAVPSGGAVTYGGDLPYAGKIERRSGARSPPALVGGARTGSTAP